MRPRSFNHRRGRQLALAASIALHGAVLVSVSQTPWTVSATLPRADAVVVWLSDWQMPEAHIGEDDPGNLTNVDVPPPHEVEPGFIAEEEPKPEPFTPTPVGESPEPLLSPPRVDLELSRPPIDWDNAMRRAIVYMREERAKADAYLTFSYPERRQEPTRDTGVDSTTIAGIQIRPSAPCVRSVVSFLARLLMPVGVCEWNSTAQEPSLSIDPVDRLASLVWEQEAYDHH